MDRDPRIQSDDASVLFANGAKATPSMLCAGGVDLNKLHGDARCPKCGATDNDACKFADY